MHTFFANEIGNITKTKLTYFRTHNYIWGLGMLYTTHCPLLSLVVLLLWDYNNNREKKTLVSHKVFWSFYLRVSVFVFL